MAAADYGTGTPFHGEFESTNASSPGSETAARIAIYPAGQVAALTLTAANQIVITDVLIVVNTAITVQVFDGTDTTVGAGETICEGDFQTGGGVSQSLKTPHYCQPNASTVSPAGYPKVITSGAGGVRVGIKGYILTGGSQ